MSIIAIKYTDIPDSVFIVNAQHRTNVQNKYPGSNISENGTTVINGSPPADDDAEFVIVDATQDPPPPPPEGGRIKMIKISMTPNEDTVRIVNDNLQVNVDVGTIEDLISKLATQGGKKRYKKSARRGRRSAKKRGTQRKQKRRQRRGSRRAY